MSKIDCFCMESHLQTRRGKWTIPARIDATHGGRPPCRRIVDFPGRNAKFSRCQATNFADPMYTIEACASKTLVQAHQGGPQPRVAKLLADSVSSARSADVPKVDCSGTRKKKGEREGESKNVNTHHIWSVQRIGCGSLHFPAWPKP